MITAIIAQSLTRLNLNDLLQRQNSVARSNNFTKDSPSYTQQIIVTTCDFPQSTYCYKFGKELFVSFARLGEFKKFKWELYSF